MPEMRHRISFRMYRGYVDGNISIAFKEDTASLTVWPDMVVFWVPRVQPTWKLNFESF